MADLFDPAMNVDFVESMRYINFKTCLIFQTVKKKTKGIIQAFCAEPPRYRLIFVYNICFISIKTSVSDY